MARRGENIYKRRDGRYEGRYVIGKRPDGKTKFGYVYGRQFSEVKRALLLKKAALLQKRGENGPKMSKTLQEWAEIWLKEKSGNGLKASTCRTYRGLLRRHILPALGECILDGITPEILRGFLSALAERGLSQATITVTYRLLSSVLSGAFGAGLICENPCRRVRLHGRSHEEQRVLSAGEQRALVAAANVARDLSALMSLYTGMRLGEVCALRWSDVDWERNAICVRRTASRGEGARLTVDAPKTANSARTIPVPAFLMRQLRALRGELSEDAYIFGGGRPAEPRTIQRRFQALAGRAGLAGVHFHTLRHSFATRMLELGVDVKTISLLLGHSTVRTTLDFYAHSLMESRRQAIGRLESAYAME